jgi:hypothetical protein
VADWWTFVDAPPAQRSAASAAGLRTFGRADTARPPATDRTGHGPAIHPGIWTATPGPEEQFVSAWRGACRVDRREVPGSIWAKLLRDASARNRFISFGPWESLTRSRTGGRWLAGASPAPSRTFRRIRAQHARTRRRHRIVITSQLRSEAHRCFQRVSERVGGQGRDARTGRAATALR